LFVLVRPLYATGLPSSIPLVSLLPFASFRIVTHFVGRLKSADKITVLLQRLHDQRYLLVLYNLEPIRQLFSGDMQAFLAAGDAFFNGVGKLLEQQFERSTLMVA
jgi:hypothetical protein